MSKGIRQLVERLDEATRMEWLIQAVTATDPVFAQEIAERIMREREGR